VHLTGFYYKNGKIYFEYYKSVKILYNLLLQLQTSLTVVILKKKIVRKLRNFVLSLTAVSSQNATKLRPPHLGTA